MATGRMLNQRISLDRVVNEELSDDTSRLLFSWGITHLDRDGRMHGDPGVFKSIVAPRSKVPVEQVEKYIQEWAEHKLIFWYEAEGDLWIWYPNFSKNQPNLRYDREPESEIPDPETGADHLAAIASKQVVPQTPRQNAGTLSEGCRNSAGKPPEDCRRKRREEKIREENNGAENGSLVAKDDLYHSVWDAFLSKQPDQKFTNYKKEGSHTKTVIEKAVGRWRDEAGEKLKILITQFWWLKEYSNDKFWKSQPFLPSVFDSLFDRILESVRQQQAQTDTSWVEEAVK